jgi:hypothetical protein
LHTYFLSREEVEAYASDFALRLLELKERIPYIWCTLGHSGEEIALILAEALYIRA